jgi:hypothetical protein
MSLEHSPAREGRRALRSTVEALAFTVNQFCASHNISKTRLYQEWKAGRGPEFYTEGAHRRISAEAAARYRARKHAEAA